MKLLLNRMYKPFLIIFFPILLFLNNRTASASSLKYESNHGADEAESVTNLSGFFRNGQVFLTWQNLPTPGIYYKVYRSPNKIISSLDLSNSEYLGYTNSESSKDHNLSRHDGFSDYLTIDSGSAPLLPSTGLFVATTLLNGSYYYAVTTLINGVEDLTITAGINSLSDPIDESVSEPQPVYQSTRLISNQSVKIYTTFTSMKISSGDLMNQAGFIANDFALFVGHAGPQSSLRIRFHPGGSDFLESLFAVNGEVIISPEDYFPSGDNSSWWGANQNFDVFDTSKNTVPPTSGINYDFSQIRMTRIINWAISHLPVDSNRIYLDGTSFGSIGAYFYAMTFPERIAAVKMSVGCFNFAFQKDFNPICTLNTGGGNRKMGNERFGTVSTNLMTNLGYHTYDILNGGWICNQFNDKPYPVIYAINGKYDTLIGWTEKTIYYDSVNANHLGGYYFYDSRNHGGIGATWGDDNFNIYRYSKNVSYPAFANCSANEDFGDGHAASGAPFGTINGFLDWNTNIEEDSTHWKATVFLRDLKEASGTIYPAPSSCQADVTPRRLQQLMLAEGDQLAWTVTHNNTIVQSGSMFYAGGIVTIPAVTVYKDSVMIELTNQTKQDSIGLTATSLIVYPNPFTESTNIRWELQQPGHCTIKVYDASGRLVKVLVDENLDPGIHQLTWNASDGDSGSVSNGVYLVRMETANESETEKLMMLQ